MFKSFKAKLLGLISLGAVMATSVSAQVLTAEQKTSLTDSLSAGYGEYIGLLVVVAAIAVPVSVISTFL